MAENEFNAAITDAASFFSSLKEKNVKIITHIDCDGVSSCAILVKICQELNRPYTLKRIRELNTKEIKKISQSKKQTIIFADMGSAVIEDISTILKEKEVIIIDHHDLKQLDNHNNQLKEQQTNTTIKEQKFKIKELNPKKYGLNERRTISSSGIAYLFAQKLINTANLAPIALLGAIGDAQEENGFIGYNQKILEQAIQNKELTEKKVIRLFGRQTRPIHKAIEYSVDIPMKELTNNKEAVKDLLRSLNIPLRQDNHWTTLATLTDEQEQLLTQTLFSKMSEQVKQKAFWQAYTITNRPKGSSTRDLREFSTLLNACGRLNDLELGVKICLGDDQAAAKAQDMLKNYKHHISTVKYWIEEHPEQVTKQKGLIIINGQDNIPPDIAGTISSIYARSNIYPDNTIICTLAHDKDHKTKISLRITTPTKDLCNLLKTIIAKTGGSFGGHSNAAGAIIDQDKEQMFIEELKAMIN